MLYRTIWFDLTYQSQFTQPLFALAKAPLNILSAIHRALPLDYSVKSGDLSVVSGIAVSDYHAKVRLFNGNGSLDITTDNLTAQFNNPTGENDGAIIQDCLSLSLGALTETAGPFDIREETLALRMFAELPEQPDAFAFLINLAGEQYPLVDIGAFKEGSEIVPGIQFEIVNDSDRWTYYFSISRSIRSRKELFISSTTRYLNGGKFTDFNQKSNHIRALITASLDRFGIAPVPKQG